MDNNTSELKFPCEFPIKIFGNANDAFETEVLTIIRKHVPDLQETAVKNRVSKESKYLAITVVVNAQSKTQLDAIYQDLTGSPLVIMAL